MERHENIFSGHSHPLPRFPHRVPQCQLGPDPITPTHLSLVGDAAEGEAWPHVGGRECVDVGVSGGEALGEALSWDWRVRVEREACGLDVGR